MLLGWHAGGSRGRGEVLLGAARMFPLHPRPPENQNPELPRGSILEGHVRKSATDSYRLHHIYCYSHPSYISASTQENSLRGLT